MRAFQEQPAGGESDLREMRASNVEVGKRCVRIGNEIVLRTQIPDPRCLDRRTGSGVGIGTTNSRGALGKQGQNAKKN